MKLGKCFGFETHLVDIELTDLPKSAGAIAPQEPNPSDNPPFLFNILRNKKQNKHIPIKIWRVQSDYWLVPYDKGTIWQLAQSQK